MSLISMARLRGKGKKQKECDVATSETGLRAVRAAPFLVESS